MRRRRGPVTEPVVAAAYAELDRQSLIYWLCHPGNLSQTEHELRELVIIHYLRGETVEELGPRFDMSSDQVQEALDNAIEWLRGKPELKAALGRGGSQSCPFHGNSWITADHLDVECPECPCRLPKSSAYDGAPHEYFCSASCAFRVMDRVVEELAIAVERQCSTGWSVTYRSAEVDHRGRVQSRPQARLSRSIQSGSTAPEVPLAITSQGWGPSGLTIESHPRTSYFSDRRADGAKELWIVWPDSVVEILRRGESNGWSSYRSVREVKGGELLQLKGSISLTVPCPKRAVRLDPFLTRESP